MKRPLLLASAALAAIICNAQMHIIDVNRIWEYGQQELDNKFTFRMKFDGEKEIDGKTYSIFKTCDAKGSTLLSNNLPDYWDITTDQPEFYIREENGKAYAYKFDHPEGYWTRNASEVLLYDFDRLTESIITGIDCHGENVRLSIISSSEVTVGNEECNHYLLQSEGSDDFQNKFEDIHFIDGIGFYNHSFLPALVSQDINGYVLSKEPKLPTCITNTIYLQRVTDLEGNVLFDPERAGISSSSDDTHLLTMKFDGEYVYLSDVPCNALLCVYDAAGMPVMRCKAEKSISLRNLPSGMYIATIDAVPANPLKFRKN